MIINLLTEQQAAHLSLSECGYLLLYAILQQYCSTCHAVVSVQYILNKATLVRSGASSGGENENPGFVKERRHYSARSIRAQKMIRIAFFLLHTADHAGNHLNK